MGQSNSIYEEEQSPSSEEEAFQRRQSAHIALNDPANIWLANPDLRQKYRQTITRKRDFNLTRVVLQAIWETIKNFFKRCSWKGKNRISILQRWILNKTGMIWNYGSFGNGIEMEHLRQDPNGKFIENLSSLSITDIQVDNKSALSKKPNFDSKISQDISSKLYLDHTFLVDDNTIKWIKSNHVVFIIRGLPGSGKTTLAKALKNVYADQAMGDFIFCSADNYFMSEGSYNYDCTKLKLAFEECHNQVKEAATCRLQTIVIDNSNILHYEMKPYFQIANREGYIVIIVEPRTPWHLDSEVLAKRNNHGVTLELIQTKAEMLKPVSPLYYGWFLSIYDSRTLITMSKEVLKMCLLNCEKFSADFKDFSLIKNVDLQIEYYETPNRKCFSKSSSRLHCTAKYCGNPIGQNDRDNIIQYASRDIVNSSIGQLSKLEIIGYVITKSTFGARLQLSDTQLLLYDQLEELPETESSMAVVDSSFEYVGAEENKNLENMNHIEKTTNFCPVSGKGQRAHITIGTACGVGPAQTGSDLLEAVAFEKCSSVEKLYYNVFTFKIPETSFVLRRYRKDLWVLYQSNAHDHFDALFTGYYV